MAVKDLVTGAIKGVLEDVLKELTELRKDGLEIDSKIEKSIQDILPLAFDRRGLPEVREKIMGMARASKISATTEIELYKGLAEQFDQQSIDTVLPVLNQAQKVFQAGPAQLDSIAGSLRGIFRLGKDDIAGVFNQLTAEQVDLGAVGNTFPTLARRFSQIGLEGRSGAESMGALMRFTRNHAGNWTQALGDMGAFTEGLAKVTDPKLRAILKKASASGTDAMPEVADLLRRATGGDMQKLTKYFGGNADAASVARDLIRDQAEYQKIRANGANANGALERLDAERAKSLTGLKEEYAAGDEGLKAQLGHSQQGIEKAKLQGKIYLQEQVRDLVETYPDLTTAVMAVPLAAAAVSKGLSLYKKGSELLAISRPPPGPASAVPAGASGVKALVGAEAGAVAAAGEEVGMLASLGRFGRILGGAGKFVGRLVTPLAAGLNVADIAEGAITGDAKAIGRGSGGLAAIAAGAAVGSIVPGIGTLAGAAIGGGLSLLGSYGGEWLGGKVPGWLGLGETPAMGAVGATSMGGPAAERRPVGEVRITLAGLPAYLSASASTGVGSDFLFNLQMGPDHKGVLA